MAVITLEEKIAAGKFKVIKWAGMKGGDVGQPLFIPDAADKTVHVKGTFTGATAVIQGSNDLETKTPEYDTLHKTDLSDLSFTVKGIFFISENPNLIRPSVSGGDGSTSLDISICLK